MRVLVTGGAGYIGSHVVRALGERGHEAVVVDDLSSGHAEAVGAARLIVADVTKPGVLAQVAEEHRCEAVMHFAARIQVGESVARPELYYDTNVGGMLRVGELAARGLPVVFSSTAAVYGEPERVPIPTDHPCRPENPYGASKWIGERILADCARAGGGSYAALRYFNAAGAADGLAERHEPETHLIPLALDAALGKRAPLQVFGDDWPTRDGTCERDYVHVVDLAAAHLLALEKIANHRELALTLNLGGGRATTVREVLEAVAVEVGKPVPHTMGPRRAGDVSALVADISAAERELGWQPTRSSLAAIVRDAARSR